MQISFKIFALFLKNSKTPLPWQRDPIGKKRHANYLFLYDYKIWRKFEAELPTLRFPKSLVLTERW